VGLLAIRTEFADFAPAPEIVVGEYTFLQMDDFSQITVQESKRAANANHVHGQVKSVEHQHTGRKGIAAATAGHGTVTVGVSLLARRVGLLPWTM
jgi:hypothetical protein